MLGPTARIETSMSESQTGRAARTSRVGAALSLVLALAAFQLGTWLVRRLTPEDTRGNIGVAHRLFREQLDEVEVVVVGSSRVQAGIDVVAVESELDRAGQPLRVFNYGVPGMRTLEQGHVLRKILAERPPRLRWVVLEASPLGITIRRNTDYSRKAEAITARAISWHTTQVTWRALAAIARFPLPPLERLTMAGFHVGLWARKSWNVGMLSERSFEQGKARQAELLDQAAADALDLFEEADADERPGFAQVLGGRDGAGAPQGRRSAGGRAGRRQKTREDVERWRTEQSGDQYARRARMVAEQNAMEVELASLDLELLREREREARAAGVELVYLTLPSEVGCPEILRLSEAGLLGPLLHFNDPERYPALFEGELRKGLGHLNPRGAQVFAVDFARGLAELAAGATPRWEPVDHDPLDLDPEDRDGEASGSGPAAVLR